MRRRSLCECELESYELLVFRFNGIWYESQTMRIIHNETNYYHETKERWAMPTRVFCYAVNADCTTMLRHSVYASITATATATEEKQKQRWQCLFATVRHSGSVSARFLPLRRVEKCYTMSATAERYERASEWTYKQSEMALVFLIEICELTCVKRTTMTRATHNNMWVFSMNATAP